MPRLTVMDGDGLLLTFRRDSDTHYTIYEVSSMIIIATNVKKTSLL